MNAFLKRPSKGCNRDEVMSHLISQPRGLECQHDRMLPEMIDVG